MATSDSTRRHKRTMHGLSKTPEYIVWDGMKGRCRNKKSTAYGGRGIRVCERWLNSFENFLADMGPRPSPKHSIDRIDNDGNYEPGNCRWATRSEQAMNRRATWYLEFQGQRRTVKEWARLVGVKYWTLAQRLKFMTLERALTTPPPPATSEHGVRRGADIHTAILTEADVISIRARFAAGVSRRQLADEYRVQIDVVQKVVSRRTWKHLPEQTSG